MDTQRKRLEKKTKMYLVSNGMRIVTEGEETLLYFNGDRTRSGESRGEQAKQVSV